MIIIYYIFDLFITVVWTIRSDYILFGWIQMKRIRPPNEPSQEECCNSGCNPCIFDVYYDQLKLYEKSHKHDSYKFKEEFGISQLKYKAFYLRDALQISDTQKILFFQKSKHDQCLKIWWKPGDHFLVKYTSADNISCTRAYTPINLKSNSKDYDFLIVVKKYTNGLVSQYLFNLTIGQETLWRGPYGSYNIQPNKFDRIIMIAQGTGVAPFISIVQNIISNEEDMTQMFLFYCSKDIAEILFRDVLYEFQSYWNFRYKIYLCKSSECEDMNKKYKEPIIDKKFDLTELNFLKSNPNDQYLLCGSIQFVKDYEVKLKNEKFSENIILF